MKSRTPLLTLLGSNSGNNVGDAAILSGILHALTEKLPGVEFLVPTANPSFINTNYSTKYKVKALDIMPWNLSLRFLGLPTLKCLWKSDAALICDGIIFGKRLYNPAFNMLITLAPLALLAKLCRCKLVCFSVGIGPFPKGRGAWLARFLINSCDLIMMRDPRSKELAQKIGVTKPIEMSGDAAYLNPISSRQRALEIAAQHKIDLAKPILGVNVTAYADAWLDTKRDTGETSDLDNVIAEGLTKAKKSLAEEFQIVVFSTHPMDSQVAKKLAAKIGAPLISNQEYLSHDMQAVMALCSLFVGMRFHSLILSSAVSVPVVGLVYAPKVDGLMHNLDSVEYALNLSTLTSEILAEKLSQAWQDRESLRVKQQRVVAKFKLSAAQACDLLIQRYFPHSEARRGEVQVLNRATAGGF